jgi:hypothetical protein
MDTVTLGGDVCEEMRNRALGGNKEGKATQQATGNEFGLARGQN